MNPEPHAAVQAGGNFMSGADGRWAGEQMARALSSGKPLNTSCLRLAQDCGPAELRALATLRKDEWKHLDDALVEEYEYNANGARISEYNSARSISNRSFTYDAEKNGVRSCFIRSVGGGMASADRPAI